MGKLKFSGVFPLIFMLFLSKNLDAIQNGERMKQVMVLRHVPFENLGYFEEVFKDRGFKITNVDAGKDNLGIIRKSDPDILVICGGPISVNDGDLYPFLDDEFNIVEERIRRKRPVLGLCLGA